MTISLNVSTSTQNPYATNTGTAGTTETAANDATATQSSANNFGPATIITLSANAELSLSQVAQTVPTTSPPPAPSAGGTVVVHAPYQGATTGHPNSASGGGSSFSGFAESDGTGIGVGDVGARQPNQQPTDTSKAATSLRSNLVAPTPAQLQAIVVLKDKINDLDPKIRAIPDNARIDIELSDGSHRIITGAEIKALWENSKWEIDPAGTSHANGSGRGASTDSLGYTHFNIDNLMGHLFNDTSVPPSVGAAYLVIHELMHNTAAGQSELLAAASLGPIDSLHSYPDNEIWADRATASLENYLGETTIPNPTYGSYAGYIIPPVTVSPPPPPPPPIDGSLPGSSNDLGFDDSANNGGWRDMTN